MAVKIKATGDSPAYGGNTDWKKKKENLVPSRLLDKVFAYIQNNEEWLRVTTLTDPLASNDGITKTSNLSIIISFIVAKNLTYCILCFFPSIFFGHLHLLSC